MTDQPLTLQHIFGSGDSRRYIEYGNMAHWINSYAIVISRQSIDTPQTKQIVALIRQHDTEGLKSYKRQVLRVHGGDSHHDLAMLAYYWLIDTGHTPKCEQAVNGHRVDVVSDDLSILIECGNTDAVPVIEHLHKPAAKVCVVPFQGLHETQGAPFMYVFERGDGFAAAYQKHVAEIEADVRSIAYALAERYRLDTED